MKKAIALVLILTLAAALCACGEPAVIEKEVEKTVEVPVVADTRFPFRIGAKTVVLCDDVIFTTRTARAAMDALLDQGRPARIQLFALIDRGHAEFPIRPTFVGKNIPTSLREVVVVRLTETDSENSVSIYEK